MTPKSLFNIVLKILGIFILRDFLDLMPQIATLAIYFTKIGDPAIGIWTTVATALTLGTFGITAYFLIFKSDLLIKILRLRKDSIRIQFPSTCTAQPSFVFPL